MSKVVRKTEIARRGLLLVMSSPSGAGKTTLSRKLLAADRNITMSVSVTTRAPRPGEIDGKDYHFISKERFNQMRDRNKLENASRSDSSDFSRPNDNRKLLCSK